MSTVVCPNCNATLPPQEIAEGWCESCGKKIPTWIQGASPARLPQASRHSLNDFHIRPTLAGPVLASRWSRLAAALIDTFLAAIVILPGAVLMDTRDKMGEYSLSLLGQQLMLIGSCLLALVQYILLSLCGQTIGKKVLRVRIVREKDNRKAGFVRAVLLRSFVPRIIDGLSCGMFNLVDVLLIFADDRRCLHDHIAGTKVIAA